MRSISSFSGSKKEECDSFLQMNCVLTFKFTQTLKEHRVLLYNVLLYP